MTVFPPIAGRYRVKRQGEVDYLAGASSVEVAFASAARRSHQESGILWMVVDTHRSVVIAVAENGQVKTTDLYEERDSQPADPQSKLDDAERLAIRTFRARCPAGDLPLDRSGGRDRLARSEVDAVPLAALRLLAGPAPGIAR